MDLDEEIVKADGRSIPDIFAAEGEAGFRKLEAAQTARFARENRQVISCGGGVVKDPANLRALHANGIVLFIDRPLEDLLVGGGRPLSTSPEALKTMEAICFKFKRPGICTGISLHKKPPTQKCRRFLML